MKRYFNVLLLILIIFCYCTFNIKLFAISNTIIENVLGTNLNSFGSAYIPEGKYQNSHSDMDIYEFNDTYDDAIKLNPINYYEVNKYHSNLNGTLDYMASLQDIDYYYFNILTDSCVVLTIETESSSPYTFALMKIEYDEVLNNEANHSLENVIYDQTSSNYKSYSDYIAPGTYYVYVRGLQTSYSVIDYEVNLYVEKTPNSSDAYINVMMILFLQIMYHCLN